MKTYVLDGHECEYDIHCAAEALEHEIDRPRRHPDFTDGPKHTTQMCVPLPESLEQLYHTGDNEDSSIYDLSEISSMFGQGTGVSELP